MINERKDISYGLDWMTARDTERLATTITQIVPGCGLVVADLDAAPIDPINHVCSSERARCTIFTLVREWTAD